MSVLLFLAVLAQDLPPELIRPGPRPLAPDAVVEESPGFLGARRHPVTAEAPLDKDWGESGPALLWSHDKGESYAAPAVVEGHLLLFHRVGDEEVLECLDPETGAPHWRQSDPVVYEDEFGFGGGPKCCPLVDQGQVFTLGVDGRLQCRRLEDGERVWERRLRQDFSIPQMFFGVGASPLLVGDQLVVNVGAPGGPSVAAFDRTSGELRWGAGDQWLASYASPVLAEVHGQPRLLVMGGGKLRPPRGGLSVIDPDGGDLLWEFPFRSRTYYSVNAPTPVVQGNEVMLCASYRMGAVKLRLGEDGTGEEVWRNEEFDPHWATPVLHEGYLYAFVGEKENSAELACVDWDSGATRWREELRWTDVLATARAPTARSFTPGRATLLRADDGYLCLAEKGSLLWLDLDAEGVEVRARTRLFFAPETWTPPVVVRGLLYVCQNSRDILNDQRPRLRCYDLRSR